MTFLKSMAERIIENKQLTAFLLIALTLRLIFHLPFYLTSDLINYLNALDAFSLRDLGDTMHIVRLGMILPSALLNLADFHYATVIYGLLTSLGTVWITYRLGNAMGGSITAKIATAIVIFAPMDICLGPVFLPDGPLSFYALSSFYFTSRVVLEKDTKPIITLLAGLLIGIAYTCKVNALFFGIPAVFHLFFG
ncbi:MAG: glycosyltransferase family 39 protein [Candidatus Latescibacterota bacterium]|nr:glycosyltransferase family 39 protein [Candidatus Latescibacterota bacterium]